MKSFAILENETWWGGAVDLGSDIPYTAESDCTISVGDVGADQSAPIYLSTKGRYLYSAKPFTIRFQNGVITTDEEVELGEGYATLKGAHQAVADKYFVKTDRIPDERFFRVPQYNTWIELMYNQNQKQILEYAHAIVDSGLTPGILMIDEGWSEDYGVFDFYPGRFEDPKAMIRELHELGFVVMLWITPHISPDSNAFRALRDTDFLLKDENGKFVVREWWNGFSCVLDLSNPEARNWLREKLSYTVETYGADGFKFDAGDAGMYRSTDRSFLPRLPQDHTTDYASFASEYDFNELRAVWNLGGASLVCRLHDKMHSWDQDGLDCIIPNTLTQGLIGCYYGCPDMIGGGNYASFIQNGFQLDEELYLKPENYQTVLELLKLRDRYAPEIISLAHHAAQAHEPIVRPVEYEFPHQGYEKETTMYMLGSRHLVIPMLEKGVTQRCVRLPAGTWKDTQGNMYAGGETITLEYPLEKIYIFERMEST